MPDTPRIIVTNQGKPRKRVVKKPAQPALTQSIVTHPSKYERARQKLAEALPPDPEAEASVAAFFARMVRPREG